MRVTQNTNFNVVRDSIATTKNRMEKLQTQAATMRKLNAPGDNPVGAAKVLEIRTDKMNNEQFFMNAKMAESFLQNSDQALMELSEIALRAKEIALGQASGASANDSTRIGVAEEVSQLFQQAVAAANRRIGDRYLFGGYKTDRAPVTEDGNYEGDRGKMMVEISRDVYIAMNVPGIEAFNTEPEESADARKLASERQPEGGEKAAQGAEQPKELALNGRNVNVFDELQNLRIALLTGNTDGIRTTLDRFDQIHSKLVATRSKIGARLQGLQSAIDAAERHNVTNAKLSSVLEDADMAKVMSELAKEETVFRSALGSSQKLIQPTLMDFLR